MRVRLDRYEIRHREMLTRTLLAFIGGAIIFVMGALGGFVGIALLIVPDDHGSPLWARRAGFFVGFFAGIVPCALGALLVWYGAKQRARFRRLGELATVARQTPELTSAVVAQGLGVQAAEAERLVLDASTLGLIEDAPPLPAAMPNATTSAATSFTPGGIVAGTYRIEEPLGAGGMGAVHAVRHMRTGRRYAMKTILPGARSGDSAIRRFEREATAASAIGHPNIVQVHDFNVTSDGIAYLVMELLEGETLEARIARASALPWLDAQRITLEIASALGAAHERGLLHRDIKPSNVFLAKSANVERAVLVDFGLVKPLEESGSLLTSMGAVVGTPMYMSPEQARGEPLDVRSDIYSLAAVVFEAMTGSPPFLDRTMAAVYARLLNEAPPRASQISKRPVPRGVDEVLARALAKNRADRFADAKSFAEAIAAIAEDAPSTARMRGIAS